MLLNVGTHHPAITAIVHHSQRWEKVNLSLHQSFCPGLVPAKGNLLLLRELIINLHGGLHAVNVGVLEVFAIVPSLRKVRIDTDVSRFRVDFP